MAVRVACLSPYDERTVRGFFGGLHEVEVAIAGDPPDPDSVRATVAGAELVIGDKRHKHRLDRQVLESMRGCRLIQQPAVGFDVIDHLAAAELGIPVANAAGYNRDAVADWTLMAILNLVRHAPWGDRQMRAGNWPRAQMSGRELGALTVGIVGFGNVGNAVATRLAAFGARLLYSDLLPRSFAGAEPRSLQDLLAESDVVCIHTFLDHTTHHLIDARAISLMRPGALLVNAARGPIVDEVALVDALAGGRLGGAALDVFETEPLSPSSPLRTMENVFLSPHVAGGTVEAESRLLEMVAANLRRVLEGGRPANVVNGVLEPA